ncbi:MAG: lipid-A-disaccharide synthase-related protein [Armatimonadota bacterium]|nr:lipid-A-disaccharide synthase-related protein [Armatimonadota bacterium]MDR7443283.1 lipid-A-disaccharide synthase-related protein [Armatimonadota bacterium]MDR7569950.1 lipid-A-disaccharide synthase-related protein [Armatimonadota bacterium]MDR7614387.1 lipid-A-disaccharide synthase-related protein [Armatimonadota bacterium]
MRILMVSNGYGEDAMGAVLGRALRRYGAEVLAYPLVGLGHAYQAVGVPVLDPRRTLPTAGFGFRTGWREAWEDLRAGWISLTLAQRRTLRRQHGTCDEAVAIGDLFCLWMAAATGIRPVYVPTAKSEYSEPHQPWELLLIRRWARVSFPRDPLTAERYRKAGLAAVCVGNLMMDCLEFGKEAFEYAPDEPVVLLLPGSRRDAPVNFRLLLQTAARVAAVHREVRWLCALSPTVDPASLARAAGAELLEGQMAYRGVRVRLTRSFADAVRQATVVLGMSGTANEQAAGLGKPVVALPGPGPQFTRKFLALQARLLGEALVPAEGPEEAARAVLRLLADPEERARRGEVGRARMGPPGAAEGLAAWLVSRRGQTEDRI